MKKIIILLFAVLTTLIYPSCYLVDSCNEVSIPQAFRLGDFEITFTQSSPAMKVGDTLNVKLAMPQEVFDSISGTRLEVENEVNVFLAMTRHSTERFDTSLIYIMDQYFKIDVLRGKMLDDPYRFELARTNNQLILELRYIPKQALSYSIPCAFERVNIQDIDTECMEGDTETWDAKLKVQAEINEVGQIYGGANEDFPNAFGFTVTP